MADKTPVECVCAHYDKEPFKSAYSDKMVHCYECGAYNDGIEKGKQIERERVIEWGDEPCEEHMQRIYRRQCPQCWAELSEESK